ncbi:LPS assembly lipoprotein LptE [Hyphococcus sp. DH-69]|uniref:LPS assembly lipoprotein LptE n=1 Tax=Hyphococcus formosus TaxID=3143534 RepID=UPI00398BBBD5
MIKLRALAASTMLFAVSACGFHPIYATTDSATGDPVFRQIQVRHVAGPTAVEPVVTEALNARMSTVDGIKPKYELYVTVTESAERLAVQIDATVTRYNYRLSARYTVVDLTNGSRFRGSARAVTSYNIVSSQYSTLFAERTAVEKAARLLAEEIERDLLIRFDEPPEERTKNEGRSYETELSPEEILTEPRRGEVIEPIVEE